MPFTNPDFLFSPPNHPITSSSLLADDTVAGPFLLGPVLRKSRDPAFAAYLNFDIGTTEEAEGLGGGGRVKRFVGLGAIGGVDEDSPPRTEDIPENTSVVKERQESKGASIMLDRSNPKLPAFILQYFGVHDVKVFETLLRYHGFTAVDDPQAIRNGVGGDAMGDGRFVTSTSIFTRPHFIRPM
ncbi:hypothetical protein P7C70_g5043, partial [Phenoliferia sp. Uapishka_3]